MEETEKHIQSEYKKLSQQCGSNLLARKDALMALKGDIFEINAPVGININRFSSVTRLLRVTALVDGFVSKLIKRKDSNTGPANADDFERAERQWITYTQTLHYSSLLGAILKDKPNNLKVQLGFFVDGKGL